MKTKNHIPESKHFTVEQLADGVYVCVHRPGGGAYSNSGIVDLGERTLVVDAFDTMAAGRDLRQVAETLFARPVDTLLLSHPHSDHWIGAAAFDETTVFLASKTTRRICKKWGARMLNEFKDRSAWEESLRKMEGQLQAEQDKSARISLENSILRTRYVLAEMADFQPRYAGRTFDEPIIFQGSKRIAEFRSLGRGHSEDDAVLFLPQERIAFIGDIGFFNTQPFLGFCDLALYRKQLHFFQDSDDEVLIPGHGPVGSREDITLQLKYMDVIEELIGNVVQRGGSFEDAMQITLPAPFEQWKVGGMGRFEVNVRTLYKHFGGKET